MGLLMSSKGSRFIAGKEVPSIRWNKRNISHGCRIHYSSLVEKAFREGYFSDWYEGGY